MPSPPEVSVIVATYRQPFSTGLALKALFAQETSCSYEVIVCDDGSEPETLGVLLDLIARAPVPARLAWQQDRGFRAAASRNNGIRVARGHILVFVDGDLVPEQDFVERHLQAHADEKTIAAGRRLWRNPEAVKGRDWQVDELWALLRGEEAFDGQSRVVEALLSKRQRKESSLRPWSSVESCNFSVVKGPGVCFDDEMVGWGVEDVDLAYRLNAVQGYEVRHIEAAAYDVLGWVNRAKTWEQSDYIAHLCNGFRFLDKWAHTGLTAEDAIPRYTLDPSTGRWSMTPLRKQRREPVDAEAIRSWLVERGYLPARGASPAADRRD